MRRLDCRIEGIRWLFLLVIAIRNIALMRREMVCLFEEMLIYSLSTHGIEVEERRMRNRMKSNSPPPQK